MFWLLVVHFHWSACTCTCTCMYIFLRFLWLFFISLVILCMFVLIEFSTVVCYYVLLRTTCKRICFQNSHLQSNSEKNHSNYKNYSDTPLPSHMTIIKAVYTSPFTLHLPPFSFYTIHICFLFVCLYQNHRDSRSQTGDQARWPQWYYYEKVGGSSGDLLPLPCDTWSLSLLNICIMLCLL